MRLSARDYIEAMTAKGLFSQASPVPEWNPAVWDAYFKLYDAHIAPSADFEIIMADGGAAFYRDPLFPCAEFGWALLAPVSHAPQPFTLAQLVAMAPDIAETFARDGFAPFFVMTDSFIFNGAADGESARHFPWLNSPQAEIMPAFDAYAASLTSERRKQMRRLYRDYNDGQAFRFEFSDTAPDAKETDYLIEHTNLRWKDDAPYALNQVLWPMAAASVLPESVRFMRVFHKNTLVFINSYMVRGDTIISQSTTRNEREFFSGLGTMIDFKTIETLSNHSRIKYLDPTCRTGLDDPDTIGVAKREVVNRPNARPVFSMGDKGLVNNPGLDNIPGWTKDGGWHAPSEPVVIGRGV